MIKNDDEWKNNGCVIMVNDGYTMLYWDLPSGYLTQRTGEPTCLIGKSSNNIYQWAIFHGYVKYPEGNKYFQLVIESLHHGDSNYQTWRKMYFQLIYPLGIMLNPRMKGTSHFT